MKTFMAVNPEVYIRKKGKGGENMSRKWQNRASVSGYVVNNKILFCGKRYIGQKHEGGKPQ